MRNHSWKFEAVVWCCCLAVALAGFSAEGGGRFGVNVWHAGIDPVNLPQSEVVALIQTHDGYLWLGTPNGLARFDGVHFEKFNDSDDLKDYQIVRLFEDSRSNLWVGSKNGDVAEIQEGKTRILDGGQSLREDKLMSVCEDATGAVWLYTAGGRLTRSKGDKLDSWQMTDRFSRCRSVIAERDGLVWVGTDARMIGINPKVDLGKDLAVQQVLSTNGQLDFLLASQKGGYWRLAGGHVQKCTGTKVDRDLGPYPWPWNKPVFAACEDLEGNLIVGTLGDGVWWFDAAGNPTHLSDRDGLSHNYILSLTMDREGNLWVGTDSGGLDRVRRYEFSVLPQTEALAIYSACEDKQGALWFNSHGGVYCLKDGALKRYGAEQGLANTNGQVVFVDRDQNVWAGAGGGGPQNFPGLYRLQNDHFKQVAGFGAFNQAISAMFQDHTGQLWVGTQRGLAVWDGTNWKLFTVSDGLSSDAVQALAEDAEGNIWVGTANGLNRLRDGKVTAFHKKDGLPGDNIFSLLVDADDALWIGTYLRGLGRFQHGKWTRFGKNQGLLSNTIDYLLEDGQGSLWMGSPVGLMRVRKEELNNVANGKTNAFLCRAYGEMDGLLSSECAMGSQPGPCRTHDGKLWFPTTRGLASVETAQIRSNTNPPPVVIEAVLVEGELQNTNGIRARAPELVTVPPGKERIDIQFTSLNLAAANKARFKYRMEGHETSWTYADGNARMAHYTKLPPGHYTFHVLACNEDEVWNETGATLALVVLPPFWQTWWFISLMAALALGLVTGVVHYFSTQRLQRQLEGMRQQQALEKERARIARDIHDQLGASMTQVSLLGEMIESDKDDPNEVEAHAQQISQTARDTSRVLDEIVWTVNPSNDTLEGLINYICKYAQEYFAVAGLRYRLDVPSQLPTAEISPEVRHNVFLAAKESVTNVVRHAKATEVWLRLRLEPGRFILEIQDNGRGPSGNEGKSTRNGLRNMQKRMEDVGGSFSLSAASEGGALVRLTVPINNR